MSRVLGLAVAAWLCHTPAALGVEIVRGPILQSPGPGSLVVVWETDVPAAGRVVYGKGALDRSVEATGASTRHEVPLEGLDPGSEVIYRVFAGTAHSRVHGFEVPPAPGDEVDFLVFGDNRSTHLSHRAVVEAMVPRAAHFVLNTGDLVDRGGSPGDWDMFFAIERPLLARAVSYNVVGNHELIGGGIKLFEKLFILPSSPHAPERDYAFDAGCMRVVVLDNAVTASHGPSQRSWLDAVLAEARSLPQVKHLVVAIHQGVHSNGPHGPSKSLHKAGLDDVMRAHGVALVVAGHDHGYERGVVDGLRYMVSGGGGAPVYKKTVERGHSLVKSAVHHFVRFRVTGSEFRFEVVLKDGSVLESCVLVPEGYSCQ